MSARKNMARAMVEAYKAGGGGSRGAKVVETAFAEKDFDARDFSIRETFVACYGEAALSNLSNPGRGGSRYLEAGVGGAVDHTAFSNLTTTVIRGLMDEEARETDVNLGDSFATTVPTEFEAGEKVIGLKRVGREANRVVRAGEEYSAYGFGEDWQTKPDTQKRGGYVLLTKEMIAEDRTGRALEAARTIIDEARMNKNERILKAVLGIDNAIYRPLGVAEATYTAATSGLDDNARVNLIASGAELVDWTDIDLALQLWADMRHKVTGRPIQISPDRMQILCMPAKAMTVRHVLGADSVEVGTVGTAPNGARTGGNPVKGVVGQVTVSNLAYSLLTRSATDPYMPGGGISTTNAKNYWYMGDFARAFEYLENWPLTVETLGADTLLGFTRDVVFGVKVSEKGVIAVKDPRFVAQMRQA